MLEVDPIPNPQSNSPFLLEAVFFDLLGDGMMTRFYNIVQRRRKQLFIGFLFLFAINSVLYTFYIRNLLRVEVREGLAFRRDFWWQLLFSNVNNTDTLQDNIYNNTSTIVVKEMRHSCSNTKQGRFNITDEFGYICSRDHLDPSKDGCCAIDNSKQFYCAPCEAESGCCPQYEICVSCCLSPSQTSVKETLHNYMASDDKRIPETLFEFCMALCRTNSNSILADHSFVHPEGKYCYG